MPKGPLIATPIKKAIVTAAEGGESGTTIGKQFGVSKGAVNLILRKSRNGEDLHRTPKSGRPRKITQRQERILVRLVKNDPSKTAVDLQHHASSTWGLEISPWTTRRILRRHNLFARRPARKPLIKESHRRARLLFARLHQNWTVHQWRKVLWSDESKFNLHNSDGANTIRRPPNTRYDDRARGAVWDQSQDRL